MLQCAPWSAISSASFELESSSLHKGVIDGDDKDLSRLVQLRVVHVGRHMLARAGSGKGAGYAHDVAVGVLELFRQVDLVAGRLLEEPVKAGHLVAHLDTGSRCGMEAPSGGSVQESAPKGGTERHCRRGRGQVRGTRYDVVRRGVGGRSSGWVRCSVETVKGERTEVAARHFKLDT